MPNNRLRAAVRALTSRVSGLIDAGVDRLSAMGVDENTLLLFFSLLIGSAVGLAVIAFFKLIDLVQLVSLSAVSRLANVPNVAILLVVVAGLWLARMLVRFGTGDSSGENIPDVMRAVAKGGGVVHTTPVMIKTAATALAIGTGASVGPEGPVAVAGSALGSKIGRLFRSGPGRLRLLVSCGAAAGISAAFNAPIAGVFFSLEKVIGTFGVSAFPPILVASVIAAAISRSAFGESPVIFIPTEYELGGPSELILYALLGVVAGVISVWFIKFVYATEDTLARVPRFWLRILIPASLVALLNIVFKEALWGRGHETFSIELVSQRTGWFLLGLCAAKIAATGLSLAATRVGGIFAPALVIGATLGGGLASLAHRFLGIDIIPEAFAVVGMAGVVAATTHAPMTAIMIVFEMTSDYALILPLMLCGAVAYITARRIHPNSMYSEWLVRRGENIHAGRDTAILERLRVKDFLNDNPDVIGEGATVRQIMRAIGQSVQIEFPVLDADLHLVGMLTYADLRTVLSDPDPYTGLVVASDLASQQYESVLPQDSLRVALQKLAVRGSHTIPVVGQANTEKLLGVIGRQEILAAYDRELLKES